MGELGAFLKLKRAETPERPPAERIADHREFVRTLPLAELREQGARCMECGVPFCHSGCPLGNLIPDWNDLVYRDRFREALDQLHRTNNFPEFTGRLCPAPCEAACVLEIDEGNAVSIKQIELAISARGWDEGWIVAQPPAARSGRTVAIVGSGPASLACAQELNRAGHRVTVFERDEAGGGLLRFGVPDFKIDKAVVERRLRQLADEGVELCYGVDVGGDLDPSELTAGFDAVVLATGSRVPRDLPIPGRELDGVHFAMEYLYQRNRAVAGTATPSISAAGKHVIVVGGGDTGADCVASAHRERAASVTQIELLGEPPASRPDDLTPWPLWPMKLRTSYALKEGGERSFAISTTALAGTGRVERIDWMRNSGVPPFEPVPGSEESHPAGLVLLAMGFVGPEPALLERLGVATDARGNVAAAEFATSVCGVFAAGDARRGQSLVVWAVDEGRRCARAVDAWLATAPARPRLARRAPLSPAPLRD
ncbi:MAG TPA: glutamate synthase subunit beta [Gaiellaceae bacterium]|nr:glutamate synthase subunit beta [Gaiellaceae bacterium]